MRLTKARIQNYRSIVDTGLFEIERDKTILVGPNEAGKTAVLQALQHINPPADATKLDALRDYPRSKYNDISTGKVKPSDVTVVEAHFKLEPADIALLPSGYEDCIYLRGRKLDNSSWHRLLDAPPVPKYLALRKDLARLTAQVDLRHTAAQDAASPLPLPSGALATITETWTDDTLIDAETANALNLWLTQILPHIDEANEIEEKRYDSLNASCQIYKQRASALATLEKRVPKFVLFNNYFRVHPLIQLDHLAQRTETKILDDAQYDYGNLCFLKLLGFTSQELSTLAASPEPAPGDVAGLKTYRDQLDKRHYQLNAASVKLTQEITRIWAPDSTRAEADRLKVMADRQYLKVVVEDDLGVDIELNQRSEGFQWLVSFFVVFFAEAAGDHKNAVLLLDEPGLNLHGLKQREFRKTLSRLAEVNQTIYSTHSPFLVGPDELDLVRVVEMTDRFVGTKVLTSVTSSDPAGLLPLQEALGYDMAQSLFSQQRNLVVEGLTDYWYVDAMSQLLRDSSATSLGEKIALVPAGSASKVVYFATILHAQKLKVVALLDSDAAGDQAARQETLVHVLGQKAILRTKDVYSGTVPMPEVEDLLRSTLVAIANTELSWDVAAVAAANPLEPIVKIFARSVADFSKYRLAKAFLQWSRSHSSVDLASGELEQWAQLFEKINRTLK
jgi:energy-coupling factor transporter ATP-binding protein EcfA2